MEYKNYQAKCLVYCAVKADKLMAAKIGVLSVFPSSQVYAISIVTYGARRLYSEEEKMKSASTIIY
jgi:hypothetical protein